MNNLSLLLVFLGFLSLGLFALPLIALAVGSKSIWIIPNPLFLNEFRKWQFWKNEPKSKLYIFYFYQELGPFSFGLGQRKVFFIPHYLFKSLKAGEMETLLSGMSQNTSFSKSLLGLVELISFFIMHCILRLLDRLNFLSKWSLSSDYSNWKMDEKASSFNLRNLPKGHGLEMENLASRCRRSLEEYNSLR